MRSLLVAVLLSAGTGAAGALQSPQAAQACSCADCDPVADAPVIVGGWVESWSEYPAAQFVPPGFVAITTHLRVAEVFKGQMQSEVEVVDHASLSVAPSGWFGGSGACGSIDEDPKGKYVILGLSTYEPDPSLMASNRIWLFYIGDAPRGGRPGARTSLSARTARTPGGGQLHHCGGRGSPGPRRLAPGNLWHTWRPLVRPETLDFTGEPSSRHPPRPG